jgi:hypothetical protein
MKITALLQPVIRECYQAKRAPYDKKNGSGIKKQSKSAYRGKRSQV